MAKKKTAKLVPMKKGAKKAPAKKAPAKTSDVLKLTVWGKPAVRVLPAYSKADAMQRLRICAVLTAWAAEQTIQILDKAEKAEQPQAGA